MKWRTFLYSPRHMTAAFVAVGWIDHGACARLGVLSDWIEWPHTDKPPVYPRREE